MSVDHEGSLTISPIRFQYTESNGLTRRRCKNRSLDALVAIQEKVLWILSPIRIRVAYRDTQTCPERLASVVNCLLSEIVGIVTYETIGNIYSSRVKIQATLVHYHMFSETFYRRFCHTSFKRVTNFRCCRRCWVDSDRGFFRFYYQRTDQTLRAVFDDITIGSQIDRTKLLGSMTHHQTRSIIRLWFVLQNTRIPDVINRFTRSCSLVTRVDAHIHSTTGRCIQLNQLRYNRNPVGRSEIIHFKRSDVRQTRISQMIRHILRKHVLEMHMDTAARRSPQNQRLYRLVCVHGNDLFASQVVIRHLNVAQSARIGDSLSGIVNNAARSKISSHPGLNISVLGAFMLWIFFTYTFPFELDQLAVIRKHGIVRKASQSSGIVGCFSILCSRINVANQTPVTIPEIIRRSEMVQMVYVTRCFNTALLFSARTSSNGVLRKVHREML